MRMTTQKDQIVDPSQFRKKCNCKSVAVSKFTVLNRFEELRSDSIKLTRLSETRVKQRVYT